MALTAAEETFVSQLYAERAALNRLVGGEPELTILSNNYDDLRTVFLQVQADQAASAANVIKAAAVAVAVADLQTALSTIHTEYATNWPSLVAAPPLNETRAEKITRRLAAAAIYADPAFVTWRTNAEATLATKRAAVVTAQSA